MVGSYERGNELQDSIKGGGGFLDPLSYYQLVKKEFAPHS